MGDIFNNFYYMKKIRVIICGCCLLFGGGNNLWAQSNTVSSGGDAIGSTGKVSYSIGQTDYITVTAGSGTLTQGVQQPFEILSVGISNVEIDLNANTYPNPVANLLVLNINMPDPNSMNYVLSDAKGRILESRNISGSVTDITMASYSTGLYLLKIQKGNDDLKTFQIIKN